MTEGQHTSVTFTAEQLSNFCETGMNNPRQQADCSQNAGHPCEITVKVSDDEQTLTQKYLRYETDIRLSHDCTHMQEMVRETLDKFKGQAQDVVVRVKYTW